jgi:hypothetical protein
VADVPDGALSLWSGRDAAEALARIRAAGSLSVAMRGIGSWPVALGGFPEAAEAFERCRLSRLD